MGNRRRLTFSPYPPKLVVVYVVIYWEELLVKLGMRQKSRLGSVIFVAFCELFLLKIPIFVLCYPLKLGFIGGEYLI